MNEARTATTPGVGPDFLRLMYSQLASRLGWTMLAFVLPLQVLDQSGSVALAGLVGTATLAAGLVTALPSGVLVDSLPRVRLLRLSYFGMAGAAVATLLLVNRWQLVLPGIACALLGSIANNMSGPVTVAVIRETVPREELGKAFSIEQGRSRLVSLLGAPIGGALYGWWPALPFLTCVALQLIGLALAWRMRVRPNSGGRTALRPGHWADGVKFLLQQRRLLFIGVLGALANFSLYGVLYALTFGYRQQGTSAAAISLIEVAAGVTGMLAAFGSVRLLERLPVGRIAFLSASLIAGGLCLAAFVPWLGAAVIGFALCGAGLTPWNAALFGFLAASTPQELQGRVQTAIGMLAGLLTPLTPLLASALLTASGIGLAAGTFAILALAAAASQLLPLVRRIGFLRDYQS
ncbi:MFS transporter [Buchananella hordeovulneris]|nr:MFS transporter [Buchananella hordeovulneris]RRD41640.1 MFS transporter [Buchananella hordeovulneris]